MTGITTADRTSGGTPGNVAEVFKAFAKLGLTSFGGPVAHLGYFREEFVRRRRWLDDQAYADLVGLCQFLPGPASSQVGAALGAMRAGPMGAAAAWIGFTMPSAALMIAFAIGAPRLDTPFGQALLHGLKLVAVAVVAQAVFGMARTLAAGTRRSVIAVAGMAAVTLLGSAAGQILAIAGGALAGFWLCRAAAPSPSAAPGHDPGSRRTGLIFLALFLLLLAGLPLWRAATGQPLVALADAFYRAGALVFGGGHVVLPLLRDAVVPPGWISDAGFLAGYGAAQAMPGPLFTFAAYLGAAREVAPAGIGGGLAALAAIFAPGLLILFAALPFWHRLRASPGMRAALAGTNAAVVGVLGAALYDPVWTSAVLAPRDVLIAVAGFVALTVWQRPPWQVLLGVVAGALLPA